MIHCMHYFGYHDLLTAHRSKSCCNTSLTAQMSSLLTDSFLQSLYNTWCNENKFTTMLPKATKAAKEKVKQTLLDGHLQEIPKKEWATPYSDAAFHEAAIEWLITTDQVWVSSWSPSISTNHEFDQPIQAFEHPKFCNMITLTSHAANSVTIPSHKMTWEEILDMFARCMDDLKTHLKVTCGLLSI